jgi:C-terminal processing protease CtpA/Prc
MRLRFFISLVIAVSVLTAVLVHGDEPSCHAAARECAQNIRQMLGGRRYVGIQIVELKPGLVVKTVLPDSPASRADMRAGDRLYAVNGKSVREATAKEFKQLLADASRTGKLWLIVQRRGALKKVDIRLEPYPKEYIDEVINRHLEQSHPAPAGGSR